MLDSIQRSELANAAIELWSGNAGSLHRVSDTVNYVYTFIESGTKRYLRLTSSRDRTKSQIEAELEFTAYLQRGSVSVMLPISSKAGRLIEEISVTSSSLFACVFNEAQGERFKYDTTSLTRDHFRLRGRILGQIHALSRAYVPTGIFRRFAWDEDILLLQVDEYLPKSQEMVWREYERLRERLRALLKSSQTYGLIHGDFGETNYRHYHDRFNVFDFDDCCYHWFVYDLAVAIYPHGWRKEGLQLLNCLLDGYAEHMQLNVTLADVTMFCQWRLVYMFLVYARRWGFENLSDQQTEWFSQKLENIGRGYRWSVEPTRALQSTRLPSS